MGMGTQSRLNDHALSAIEDDPEAIGQPTTGQHFAAIHGDNWGEDAEMTQRYCAPIIGHLHRWVIGKDPAVIETRGSMRINEGRLDDNHFIESSVEQGINNRVASQ
jgi:hypothetical protein